MAMELRDTMEPRNQTPARTLLWLIPALLAFFAAIAPTLTWLEFSSGGENLVVSTALETRRNGTWLLPTLNGEPRVNKPPLAAWVAAAAAAPDTVQRMSSRDPADRDAARHELAWQMRWPFVVFACVTLAATFALGHAIGGTRIGWISMAALASSLIFLRANRAATTDVLLAMCAAIANAALAFGVLRGRVWLAAVGAGVALGLGIMSKGPVLLLQTLLPFFVFVLMRRWIRLDAHWDAPAEPQPRSRVAAPILVATLLALAIGLPWYLAVALGQPQVLERWRIELLREGATGIAPGRWYNYISFLPLLMPWTPLFLLGAIAIVYDALPARFRRPEPDDPAHPPLARFIRGGPMLALLLVVVPIVAMSFFRDRKERYLLPMGAPAAVVVAVGVAALHRQATDPRAKKWVPRLHWGILILIAVGLPIAGATLLKTLDGRRWFPPWLAGILVLIAVIMLAAGMRWARRLPTASLVVTTCVVMLFAHAVLIQGYRDSREGRSEMKPLADLIWNHAPDADVITTGRKRQAPVDLPIYLNRNVPWVPESELQASPPGQILVIRQDEDEPPPPAPANWRFIAKVPRDNSWWHAFERVPG